MVYDVLYSQIRQPELRPESFAFRVLSVLPDKPLSKSGYFSFAGTKRISGRLNKVVRHLLDEKKIEYTIPDKPGSRLQKYVITVKGKNTIEK